MSGPLLVGISYFGVLRYPCECDHTGLKMYIVQIEGLKRCILSGNLLYYGDLS